MMKHWIQATRLRTLPLAIANISMGSIVAALYSPISWLVYSLTVFTAVSLQVLSNLANDYGDSINGADLVVRDGPNRQVQSGAITSSAMLRAMWIMGIISLVSGCALVLLAIPDIALRGIFIGLGLLCIWGAVRYTAGDNPYGYKGLGDASVFIFFGLVAVIGSFYLQTGTLQWEVLLPATTCGLLSVGVLNINNIRDIRSDSEAGKRSIPVIIGRKKAIIYHWIILLVAMASLIYFTTMIQPSIYHWVFILTFPLFLINGRAVASRSAIELDPFLKQLALSTVALVALCALGWHVL